MSLLSLPRAAARSRRLVVCSAAATLVLLPGVAQAETVASTTAAESTVAAVESPVVPVEDPVAEVPAEDAPIEDAAVEGAPVGEPSAEVPSEEVPSEEVPSEEVPSEEAPSEEASGGKASGGKASGGKASGDEISEGELPDGEVPVVDAPVAEQPTDVPLDPSVTFPEIDPEVVANLFVPVCDTGMLTGLTLQLDQLRTLLQQLKDGGFPVPDEVFAEIGTGTLDIPIDDTILAEVAKELNAASAQFAELGLVDAELTAALEQLPAGIRADVEKLIGELQTGTVQVATLRSLLMQVFPCPVVPPVAPPVVHEEVVYPGYAPTGGNGSTGSPLALLGAGGALLAGGGLFAASAVRSRAARA